MLILFFFTEGVPIQLICKGSSFDELVRVNGFCPVDPLVFLEPLVVFDGEAFFLDIVLALQDVNHPLSILLFTGIIATDVQTAGPVVLAQEIVSWTKL